MADITACADSRCPSRMLCYRYTCEKEPMYQVYVNYKRSKGSMMCSVFWSNEDDPDPSDTSVSHKTPNRAKTETCCCEAFALPHKRNAFRDILEARLEFHLRKGAKMAGRKPGKGVGVSKLFKKIRSKRGVHKNRKR